MKEGGTERRRGSVGRNTLMASRLLSELIGGEEGTMNAGISRSTSPDGTSSCGTSPRGTLACGTLPDDTSPDGTSPGGTSLDGTSPDGTSSDCTSPLTKVVGNDPSYCSKFFYIAKISKMSELEPKNVAF